MGSSVDALARRLDRAKHHIDKLKESRLWVFVLEDGQSLTPEQQAKIGPHDKVVIRLYPKGYLEFI